MYVESDYLGKWGGENVDRTLTVAMDQLFPLFQCAHFCV